MSSTTLRGAGYSGNITELYDALKEVWQSDMMALINDGTMFPKYRWDFYDLGNGVANIATLNRVLTPTFTRASTATTVGSDGTVIKGIANDSPRSWYNPTTLAYEGLLMEGARTNLCLRSEEFDNASWTKTSTTVTANAVVAPDGTTTADYVKDDSSTGFHFITQGFTKAASNIDTSISMWVKWDGGQYDHLTLQMNDGGNACFIQVDLANAAVVVEVGGSPPGYTLYDSSVTQYPNGWMRIVMNYQSSNSTSDNLILYLSTGINGESAVGDGSGMYFWGAQKEVGRFASSYIPTTTVAVARAVDALSYPLSGTDLSGSVTWYPNAVGTGLQVPVLELRTDGNNRNLLLQETTNQVKWYVAQAGSTQADPSAAGTLSNGVETTAAAKSANNDLAVVRDGGTVVTDVSGTAPAWTTISFGQGITLPSPEGIRIRAATLFDRAVEDAHLQGMT